MKLPQVWNEGFGDYISSSLKHEAARWFRIHQLPDSLEEWTVTKCELRKTIWQSLRVLPDHELELDYHETGSIDLDGYSVKRIYYQSRKGFYVTANLYVPHGQGPFPGILGVHGHHIQGKIAERVQARGHSLARNGYVCLMVDAFGSGERATTHGEYEYHGYSLGGSLMNIGETLMGVQVVDNMRGIDLLCSLDSVNSSKIGVTGASGGGNQTMWLAALDDRITAAVPVVSVGTFESYVMRENCVCELLPDGLTFTEESGVLALIAPRAVKICNCLRDSFTFHPSEMLRSYAEARKIFQQYEADDKFAYQIFDMPHGYWPEIREAMLGWFDLHLKGIGTGAPKRELPFEFLPEEDLMVFEKGKRDERVISIAEYCRRKGSELKEKSLSHSPDPQKLRAELTEILRTGPALKLKTVHHYSPYGDWKRIALETECGRMLPLLVKEPTKKTNEYLLIAAPHGKAELRNTKLFTDAARNGKGMIILDLWGTGETAKSEFPIYLLITRALLWLGRTLMGEWIKDYSLAASFVKDSFPDACVTFYGYAEAGIAALFCVAVNEYPAPVILERSPVSLRYNQNIPADYAAMSLLLPDILKWGDISQAVALAPNSVHFVAPVYFDGKPITDNDKKTILQEFEQVNIGKTSSSEKEHKCKLSL